MPKPPGRAALRRAFGKTVRGLRLRAGLSQERLALEAGVGRGYMGSLERGLHIPGLENIYRLLPILGVSFPDFARELEHNLHNPKRP